MAKYLVAARQKIVRIDLLEMVHVDIAERQRAGIAGMAFQLESRQFLRGPAIEKAGQRVGEGQPFPLARPLLKQMIGLLQLPRPLRNALFEVSIELPQLLQQVLSAP